MNPLSASQLDAWRAFLNAHAAVVRRIDRDLAEAGLPPLTWYDVLWALYRASERRLRMNDLVDHVVLTRTGMTRLIDRMEAAGTVRREAVPGDRRGAYAVLTEEGVALLRRMWHVYEPGLARYFGEAVGEQPTELSEALRRVVASCAE